MADVSKVNVNSTDYNIKDSNAMHKGVDRVTAGQSIIAPIGTASTADGYSVNASGDYSHASGYHTIASSDMQHVIGKYNEEDANDTYAFIVGGGRLDFDRKNIFTIDWNGDVNAGRSNGLTNDTKLPTGADVISYLNSNLGVLDNGGNHLYQANADFNTITKTGMYLNTLDVSNRPPNSYGWYILLVFTPYRSGNSQITVLQIAAGISTNKLSYRFKNGSEWTAWVTL